MSFFVHKPEFIRGFLDRKGNWYNPWRGIVGQDMAVDTLVDLCFKAMSNSEHLLSESIVMCGPPSSGKTTLVKVLKDILAIPTVMCDGSQLLNAQSLVDAILRDGGEDLELQRIGEDNWLIEMPASIIFVDEIHALTRKVQDSLLKATERSDGMLFSKKYVVDCRKVFWIGATTDWGKLCGAFRSRFRRIDLLAPTFDEVVQMVVKSCSNLETAKMLVRCSGVVPREAHAFLRSVKDCMDRKGIEMSAAIKEVSIREGIDCDGMRFQRVKILRALRGGDCLLRDLVSVVGCQKEELLTHWLPPLLMDGLVVNDGKYSLTAKGLELLRRKQA